MRIPLLAALALLAAPASAVAQHTPADPSRIILPRGCNPDSSCTPRAGLVWNDSNPVPRYPPVMQDVGISGQVLVQFTVLPSGTVDPESITLSHVTNRAFEAPVQAAAKQWRFGVEGATPREEAIATELRVLFASPRGCSGEATSGHVYWVPDGHSQQLIVGAGCQRRIPRDQVRPHNPRGN